MSTRFMFYNIYKGAEGRRDFLRDVVLSVQPTVMGFSEANGWGEGDITPAFAERVALPHVAFSKSNTDYDLVLFSRMKPNAVFSHTEGFWHSCLIAIFRFPAIGEIAVAMVHLNPRDEKSRVEEMKKVLSLLSPYRHSIIMGDFNSLSPHDPYDRELLLTLLQSKNIAKFGTDTLRFDTITWLEQAGYVDAVQALSTPFETTVPTPSNLDFHHSGPVRLDYLFVSSPLASWITSVEVLKNPITDQTSDHYPVVVDFAF